MKKSDLFREWAWVLDACEGTGVNPRECVKIDGAVDLHRDPVFDLSVNCYTFMVTILEGKPLFFGDEVYWGSTGEKFEWDKGVLSSAERYQEKLTWTPRTITLNGEKLPAPDSDRGSFLFVAGFGRRKYYFKDHEDMSKVEKAINKLLSGK